MELIHALTLAREWRKLLEGVSHRIEIVGSVRRCKPVVKDIELLLIPTTFSENDLFGICTGVRHHLDDLLGDLYTSGRFRYVKNGPKYKKLKLRENIHLDLFLATEETWGVEIVVRTGPAALSGRCVTHRNKMTRPYDGISYPGLLPSWAKVSDGWKVHRSNGRVIQMLQEQDFLDFLGLGWVEPSKRIPDLKSKS